MADIKGREVNLVVADEVSMFQQSRNMIEVLRHYICCSVNDIKTNNNNLITIHGQCKDCNSFICLACNSDYFNAYNALYCTKCKSLQIAPIITEKEYIIGCIRRLSGIKDG